MAFQHSQEQIKQDASRAADGYCPETGRDLRDAHPDAIRNHAHEIFPRAEQPGLENTDYVRRFRLLMRMADERESQTKAVK